MVVDRLEVHLARVDEVALAELAPVPLEDAPDHDADRVLDEAGLEMRVLDDEQLVGPLEQRVDRSAHGALHDVDELLAAQPRLGADDERAAAALVVGGERDELENPLDVLLAETGLLEAAGRALADEALSARAGVDPGRLDADRAARPGR